MGTKNTIPANSYVYCSFESLKVFDRLERLAAANDKVALVKLGLRLLKDLPTLIGKIVSMNNIRVVKNA